MGMKKVVDFLIFRPAFTQRNITSLGLVGIMFGVYAMCGGKVTWAPKLQRGSSFGSVQVGQQQPAVASKSEAPAVNVGVTGDVVQPASLQAQRIAPAPVAAQPKAEERPAVAQANTKGGSNLTSLEERLKNLGSRKR